MSKITIVVDGGAEQIVEVADGATPAEVAALLAKATSGRVWLFKEEADDAEKRRVAHEAMLLERTASRARTKAARRWVAALVDCEERRIVEQALDLLEAVDEGDFP